MIYYSKENRRDYTPPLLGNGDIAFNADCEGNVFKDGYVYSGEDAVYRAGRRASYHPSQNPPARLLHWGSIKFDFGGSALSFSHELHERDGYITSSCRYGAFEADSCMFVHQKCNLYAVSKTFNGEPEKAEVTVSFDSELERNTKSIGFEITDNTAVIDLDVTAKIPTPHTHALCGKRASVARNFRHRAFGTTTFSIWRSLRLERLSFTNTAEIRSI